MKVAGKFANDFSRDTWSKLSKGVKHNGEGVAESTLGSRKFGVSGVIGEGL